MPRFKFQNSLKILQIWMEIFSMPNHDFSMGRPIWWASGTLGHSQSRMRHFGARNRLLFWISSRRTNCEASITVVGAGVDQHLLFLVHHFCLSPKLVSREKKKLWYIDYVSLSVCDVFQGEEYSMSGNSNLSYYRR